jgi:putative tryptophan/tyrosine transport system substrate-binding protein
MLLPELGADMRRRKFIILLGGAAAAWPLAAHTQQPAMPVIGFLSPESLEISRDQLNGFHRGLGEAGYAEGQNVTIEYRWGEGRTDRLPALAVDLVRRKVAAIVTMANVAAVAAKAATTTIPIVFTIGGDPVKMGLVGSFNRPGGSMTGVSFLSTAVVAKMLEVLHEVAPNTAVIAALMNPANPQAEADAREVQEAARVLGLELQVLNVGNQAEIDTAFASLVQRHAGGLLIEGDGLFVTRMKQLVVLTARHGIAAIYQGRDFPDAGGLMSYGANRVDALRMAGVYAGRILKGEKPADLPVQQSTKVELIINLATAKALGLTIPLPLLGRADEVIE